MPDGGDRAVSLRSAAVGILVVVLTAAGVALAGWVLAVVMTLLAG